MLNIESLNHFEVLSRTNEIESALIECSKNGSKFIKKLLKQYFVNSIDLAPPGMTFNENGNLVKNELFYKIKIGYENNERKKFIWLLK